MSYKISESGMIDAKGYFFMPMDRLNEFFQQNKGKRVVVRFEAAEPGSSALQQAYYFNYIVPTIQTALWQKGDRRTERQVDLWLRQQCASCYNEFGGLLEARQIKQQDFSEFIDWLKQFAAENLSVYIEDSKTL